MWARNTRVQAPLKPLLMEHLQYHCNKNSSKRTEEAEEKIFSGWKYTRCGTKCGRACLGGWKDVAHHFEIILPQISDNEIRLL